MKFKRQVIAVLVLGAVLALAGCGRSSKGRSDSAGSETEPMAAEQTQPAETAQSDYAVTIDGARVTENMTGDKVVVITYTFTNNSDDKASFTFAISTEVYQNGVELDKDYFVDDVDSSASLSNIKPGASIQVEEAYALDDMSDIEVEVSELLSFSNDLLASQTFTLE